MKGVPSYNKGKPSPLRGQKRKPFSDEWKKNISLSQIGKPRPGSGFKKGHKTNLGKKWTEESRKKLSETRKGMKLSQETRAKMSAAARKKVESGNHHLWQGGITPINVKIRHSFEYKLWREAVFKRDKYTCIWCGDNKGGNLNADHIKPFAYFPELRFAIDNGRTLCIPCHKKTDNYAGRGLKRKIKNVRISGSTD